MLWTLTFYLYDMVQVMAEGTNLKGFEGSRTRVCSEPPTFRCVSHRALVANI